MKQLTALDNMFLALEHGNQTMHVASLAIYDPSTADNGKVRFKQILAHYASRLEKSKIFQRRLINVPLGLDLPYWIDQGAIDLEYHVRHIALPLPGDWRQLMIQVARLHSRPLDMRLPLWEAYVIEGLDNIEGLPKGCFALYCKMHHSLVDGETGAELVRIQHDLTPIGRAVERLQTYVADSTPGTLELLSRALNSRIEKLASTGRFLLKMGSKGVRAGSQLIARLPERSPADLAKLSHMLHDMLPPENPTTRFSKTVSPHRIVDGMPLPLAGFQAIRQQLPGITINDIFLAVCGGAVRRYLEKYRELPDSTLHAMVPISTRGEKKETDAGNMVSGTITALHTEIADPVERVKAIHRGMEKAKGAFDLLGPDVIRQLSQNIPAAAANFLLKHVLAPRASVIVSNVKGPNVPLYFAGARMVRFMPISIATDGIGLNVTGFSYDKQLWVCVVSCRKMIPDPAFFSACLSESFDELLNAVTGKAHH